MATANKISVPSVTFSISSTAGDSVETRGNWVKCKNGGANLVSFGLSAPVGGVVAAGNQSTLNKIPTTGAMDYAYLAPNTIYFFTADTSATLVCFEEIYSQPYKQI